MAIVVKIRGQKHSFVVGTSKADIARALFASDLTITSNEVSKAVPMAYSQAMTIRHKMMDKVPSKPKASREDSLLRAHGVQPKEADRRLGRPTHTARHLVEGDLEAIAKRDIPTARTLAKVAKAKKRGVTARVGKLRTGGHPTDIDVGECANCGFDLVVRSGPTGYMIIHVNTTAEEYLATTQFCQGIPRMLLP